MPDSLETKTTRPQLTRAEVEQNAQHVGGDWFTAEQPAGLTLLNYLFECQSRFGVHLRELADGRAIDRHASFKHQTLGRAAGRDSRLRQKLL